MIDQEASPVAAGRRRWTAGRFAVVAIVTVLVAMWVYVLYLAFGPGTADNPDKLADPAFATAAETRCARTLATIDALPVASAFKGRPAARADEVAGVNDELASMLGDLRSIAPAGEDGRLVGLWLRDWETFLGDRRDYVARLRADAKARLYVTEKHGLHITEDIDGFAKVNHMASCATPPDV